MKNKGFSLFEVVVYIAIVSIIMVVILAIAAESMSSRVKAVAMQRVNYQSQFVLDRLTNDIRAATDINAADLAANILHITLADGTTHQYQVIDQQMTESINGAEPIALTTNKVTVDEFTLTDRTYSETGTDLHDIMINLTISSVASNVSPEYNATQTLNTTVSTRL